MGADNAPAKIGAPSIYTDELALEFCTRVTSGRSVVSVCKDEDMPCEHTIYRWQNLNPAFSQRLARARADRTAAISDRMVDLGAEALMDKKADPARIRVAVDALDKAARIMQPRKIELTGAGGGPIRMQAFDPAKLAQLSEDELNALERAHRILGIASGDPGGEGEASGAEGA